MDSNILGTRRILPLTLSMALPVMLTMAFQAVYNIADSLFISRYSAAAFAGVSVIQPLVLIITSLSSGLGTGLGSMLSRSLGSEDIKAAKNSIGTAWSLVIVLTILLAPLTLLAASPFTLAFTSDPEASAAGIIYLKLYTTAIPAVLISSVTAFILQSHGKSKSAAFMQAGGAIINIILDPILIFTLGMGTAGAVIATVIGFWFSSVTGLALTLSGRCLKAKPCCSKESMKGIAAVALPALMVTGAGPIVSLVLNRIVLSYGINAMVIYGMYLKMESFVFLATSGISSALVVITGYNYGAGRNDRVRSAYWTSLALGWSLMLIGFGIFQLITPELVAAFTDDPAIIKDGIPAFRRLSCCFLLTAPNIITTGLLQGLGKGGRSMLITYLRFFVFLIPLAFILSHFFGFNGFCLSYFSADIPTLFVIAGVLLSVRKLIRA